jgi:hypothetical protein
MTIRFESDEVSVLRDLLADAHGRIRELQVQVQQLTLALLMRSFNDRRRVVRPHPERRTGAERRSMFVFTTQYRLDAQGAVRHGTALGDPDRDA